MAARVGVGAVGGELEEVERVRDGDRARQIRDEDDARLQGGDEQRLPPVVVANDLPAQLLDAPPDLLTREVDVPDLVQRGYEASSSRYRSARRSTSRL